jgi:hypothetical protein
MTQGEKDRRDQDRAIAYGFSYAATMSFALFLFCPGAARLVVDSWEVFLAMAATDWVWARYTQNVQAGRAFASGFYSGLIVVGGAFSVVRYVEDHRLVVPASLGALFGTWLAVRGNRGE